MSAVQTLPDSTGMGEGPKPVTPTPPGAVVVGQAVQQNLDGGYGEGAFAGSSLSSRSAVGPVADAYDGFFPPAYGTPNKSALQQLFSPPVTHANKSSHPFFATSAEKKPKESFDQFFAPFPAAEVSHSTAYRGMEM